MSLTNNTGSRVSTKRGTPDWPVRSRELGKQDDPRKKIPEKGERKTKERKKGKTSPKGKEEATVIRDEHEVNLFLECLVSINQPPTAINQPTQRKSTRHSQSTTPSPSTQTERATRRNNSTLLTDNQQQERDGRSAPRALLVNDENVNFEAWQDELRAGHTTHVQYHDWRSERTDDNRRLVREAAATEEQNRDKRLLANSLVGWGNGLNRTITTKVVMSKDKETSTQLQKSPSPTPAEEQQRDPMTSSERPLLSSLAPPGTPLLPGTVTTFPQDFNAEGTESDRSDASLGTDAGLDPTNRSFGTEAEMELDYDGTSSEEERPIPSDQSVPTEPINQSIQPMTTEPINQSIQPVTVETSTKTFNPPVHMRRTRSQSTPQVRMKMKP